VNVACAPVESAVSKAAPSAAEPSLNVTVPVGVTPYWSTTSAVKVTFRVTGDGLRLVVSEVVVVACTVWLSEVPLPR